MSRSPLSPPLVPDGGAPPRPTLRLAGLACRRGGKLLFDDVNLALPAGQLVWLRGRNGCGKTSLLRLVAGLSRPERGEVLWGGEAIRGRASYGEQLLYLAHANGLNDDLGAAEALAFLARLHGRAASAEAVRAALDALGVAARQRTPVRSLSQGQRRRVALARLALDQRPSLWVLDEPFDALDAEGTQRLCALLAGHLTRGGSVLLSSHQPFAGPQLQATVFDLEHPPAR